MVINSTSAVQIIIKALSALSATAGAAVAIPGRRASRPKPDLKAVCFILCIPVTVGQKSESRFVGFAGTNTNHALQFGDKNFAVANFSGPRGLADHLDHFIQLIVGDCHVDFTFGRKFTLYSAPR